MSKENHPSDNAGLDECGCCEGEPERPATYNRPGLPTLSYRIGTHASFFRRMVAGLSDATIPDGQHAGARPLDALATRAPDDPSVSLLDAAATVADVLAFYQERIANEVYLRTSSERRSVLELARAIGYELNPGVSASTYLAFTLDDLPGAPTVSEVPKGTRVQSVPPQGKQPQTFETVEEITARAEWGAIRPRLTQPQLLQGDVPHLFLKGAETNLKKGDRVLIVKGNTFDNDVVVHSVKEVEVRADQGTTHVLFAPPPIGILAYETPTWLDSGTIDTNVEMKSSTVQDYIIGKRWTDRDLNVFLSVNNWDKGKLLDHLARLRPTLEVAQDVQVFALRERLGFFGHNAPLFQSLPKDANGNVLYPGQDWDGGWGIWLDPSVNALSFYSEADVYLERSVPGVIPASWVFFQRSDGYGEAFRVLSVSEKSLAIFAITGKATGLVLADHNSKDLGNNNPDKNPGFLVRNTTAFVQSERLELDALPFLDDIQAGETKILLDRLMLGFRAGQAIIITGERADAPGVTNSEALAVASVNHFAGYTELTFDAGLQHSYKRDTVTLNANVALATHGETVREILGSGKNSEPHQRFVLKRPPLSHVPALTPSGAKAELAVRVSNILWDPAPSLYGLDSRSQSYVVRVGDDGRASVIFGDGKRGARLPSGAENIVASYRTGTGPDGEVDAGSLTLLQSRPLGIRGVTNPLPASGAAAPQRLEDARENAPLTVLTLDRMVSLQDYEDFTRSFAGIGKAQAVALWTGETRLVHITIAASSGKVVDKSSNLYVNLLKTINAFRDPAQQVLVDSYRALSFDVSANVIIDPRHEAPSVRAEVEAALLRAFAFPRRAFGQAVSAAEVMTVIQTVGGVIACDIDALHLSGDPAALNQILLAATAHEQSNEINPGELLLINPLGVKVKEVKQ
ncbi:MAG TPA: putative baseplate assembly protein [Blastocatellia bacterium]|nr:putative baseplate assembly protein [Blastocatellia bacterium]